MTLPRGTAYPMVMAVHGPRTRLRELIARSGHPVYVVAAVTRINPKTLSAYINGRVTIPPMHRIRLADALGVDPEDLD